jgi:isoleucyl-tRNA synthetase
MSFSFPKEEEKVLEFWNKIDAFQKSLKLSEGRPEYLFYDGFLCFSDLVHFPFLFFQVPPLQRVFLTTDTYWQGR